jgi:hypothetical protein
MLYYVNYDLKPPASSHLEFMQRLKECGTDRIQCLSNSWIIFDNKDQENTIYNNLREKLDDSDALFISKCKFDDVAGWVPTSVIDFLKKYNDDK